MRKTFYEIIFSFMRTAKYIVASLICMIFYALVGVFFFKGDLESRCRLTARPDINNTWIINDTITSLCCGNDCPFK